MATAPDIQEVEGTKVDAQAEANRVVFERAMTRFAYTVPPQQEIRALALQARRFCYIAGAQWEGPWGETFENAIKLEIDKVKRGVDKIRRDYRANRIAPDFRPKGGDSDQETADTLDGMYRADSNHFKAQQALDNAFEEAVAGGFGAWRLTTAWADPLDKDSDEQRINPGMTIVDADQRVFFDPNSKLYDKSDARFAYVLTADQRQSVEEEYPGCVTWGDDLWKTYWDWFTPDVIVKCEYYEVEEKDSKLLIFTQALSGEEERWWSSDLTPEDRAEYEARGYVVRTQTRKRRRIRKWLLSGGEVLRDYGYIAGDCIPVIPVYGDRTYIDNMERFEGYVARRMDAQRVYNSSISRVAEVNALAPREKPIFAAEQMPPHLQTLWANQEIERHPYALVNPLIDPATGQMISPGPIGKIEAPQFPPVAAALLTISKEDLLEDLNDPDEVAANVSAEAMDIAATRVDARSGIFLDNMAQSVQRAGEVYLSMCRDIYWQQGRVVETQSEDGDDGEAVLGEPYTDKAGKYGVRNDFSRGQYKVVVSVTEATATRRDKTVKSMLKIAEMATAAQDMEGAQAAMITAGLNLDGEGLENYQKWNRRRAIQMGLEEPNEEEQAEMAQAQQNQQPDPTALALMAQAKDSAAAAELKAAQKAKTEAEVGLTEAKTVETLASAKAKGADAQATMLDAHVGAEDAATRRFAAIKPANDREEPRQRIRRGNEL
jgi:hypothetical protein